VIRIAPVPRVLEESADAIRRVDPMAQPAHLDISRWREAAILSDDLARLTQAVPAFGNGAVTRKSLREAAQAYAESRLPSLSLFVGVMIWGYADPGYGPTRVTRMLRDRQQALARVERALAAMRDGDIAKAYEAICFPRVGTAFGTKFLAFASRPFNVRPTPLILDSRVCKAFRTLLGAPHLMRDFARRGLGVRDAAGYVRYVHTMNEWAERLGCDAEQIELYLFEKAGRPWGLRNRAKS
jgi:hypothetical protein